MAKAGSKGAPRRRRGTKQTLTAYERALNKHAYTAFAAGKMDLANALRELATQCADVALLVTD